MNNQMTNQIMGQLEFYSDRAKYFQDQGDTEMKDFFVRQGYDLISAHDDSIMFINEEDM